MRSVRTPAWRARLARELPGGIAAGEVFPYYQPRLAAADGRCVGMEALARWRSPTLGNVPPSDFIPFAENTALIVPLGQQILEAACQDTAGWIRTTGHDLCVSVNASPIQLAEPSFPANVGHALASTDLMPSDLEIEITERLTLEGLGPCLESIHALHSMGVRFALDDFGSGSSALSCLVDLPLNTLKLDRSLLRGLRDNPDVPRLLRGTCGLAHELGLIVVAEGVDSEGDRELLAELGCDQVQGFGIGEAMPAEAFRTFLLEREPKPDPGR